MSKAKKVVKHAVLAVANPRRAREDVQVIFARKAKAKWRREQYLAWYEKNKVTDEEIAAQKKAAKKFKSRPLISILVPTYNTNPPHLRECLDSVLAQTYTNWELCIADDASPNQETKDVLKEYAKKYKNIRVKFSEVNQHIALTTNIALEMAKGEYISLLDHDDLLEPNALFETVKAINENPGVDLIYSDEDKIEDDKWHVEPFFKPDWSPDFMNSCNMVTHFATLSAKIMKKINGFTIGTEGAQDWDLFLKATAASDKIHHISKILYNWRKSPTSTAQAAKSKPYAYINQKKVLRNYLAARGISGAVETHPVMGFWRISYTIKEHPLVSIVIPTKDEYMKMSACVDSILELTSYPYFEIVLVDTGSTDERVEAYYDKVTRMNPGIVKVVRWKKTPFNYSDSCNFGAKHSRGEYLLFLNNDTELKSHSDSWIQNLLEHAQRDNVGAVGAKLLFPSDRIQHAGVVVTEQDIAFHPFYNQIPEVDIFTYIYVNNVRNVAAVTGACLMVSRKKFDEVGGFDVKLRVTYNDVDLCLKLLDAGYLNVYTPFVELTHYESVSVGKITTASRDTSELEAASALMRERWSGKFLGRDPYYNENFVQRGPGYELDIR
ncbi:MAG TPA: glycosyltransferase family 2 protein [Candidatus Saccharimonadales bacterium]